MKMRQKAVGNRNSEINSSVVLCVFSVALCVISFLSEFHIISFLKNRHLNQRFVIICLLFHRYRLPIPRTNERRRMNEGILWFRYGKDIGLMRKRRGNRDN